MREVSVFLPFAMAAFLVGCAGCNRQATDKDVMAKVNGYKVLRSEVDKLYNTQIGNSPQKPSAEEEEAARLNILRSIIDIQLHLQKAEKLGIVATDDEVDTKFNQTKAPYSSEEFQKKIKDLRFTETEFKQQLRNTITINKLLNKEFGSKVTISDSEIQNYYNDHKAQFNLIEPQYSLAHILVVPRVAPGASAGRLVAARVESVAEAVADDVECGDGHEDRHPREDHEPPGVVDELLGDGEDASP